MARLSQFDYDLFVSYGWSDIADANEGDRGWVADFKHHLQIHLSGELGRGARVFLDAEQPHNGELEANLSRASRSSAILLSVITPGSCREDSWCQWEIKDFLNHSGNILPNLGQVFTVRLRDVPQDEWPASLRTIVPYDLLTGPPRRLPLPRVTIPDTSTVCGGLVQNIAADIAKELKALELQIRNTVWVGHVSPEMESLAKRIEAETLARGGKAIRGCYRQGESEDAFVARTVAELKGCSLAVHFAGGAEIKPAGWSETVGNLQINASVRRFGEEKNRLVIWQFSGKASEPPPDALKTAQILKGTGFEYLESLISDLADKHSREAESNESPSPQAGRKYVYVECVPGDLKRLEALRLALEPHGVRLRPPLFEGEEATRRQLNGVFLNRCDAVAVYFGDRNELNACIACQDLWDSLGARKTSVPRAVLLDPDSDPVRRNFLYPDFENYALSNVADFVGRVIRQEA